MAREWHASWHDAANNDGVAMGPASVKGQAGRSSLPNAQGSVKVP
jgi:hypothetical protein